MATINVLDAASNVVALEKPLTPGRAAAASSRPVALSTEDLAALSPVGRAAAAASRPVALSTEDVAALSPVGRAAAAASRPVVLSTEDLAALSLSSLTAVMSKYETVAASQTDQALGPTGATGDYLAHVLIVPATTSPGAVSIKDGGGSAVTIFTGGATSVSNLVPFSVALGIKSTAGAWKVTTGVAVSAIGVGNFT